MKKKWETYGLFRYN